MEKRSMASKKETARLFEALMEKVMHNEERKMNSVFFPQRMCDPRPKEIQTWAELSITCYEWNNPEVGQTVELAESKGRKLVILKERRMKCSSSRQVEVEEVTMRYRMCTYCQSWCRNKTRWCEGCRSEVYCSRTCQTKDWKRHKDECIPMQNAEEIAREARKLHVLEFLREGKLVRVS